MFHGWIYPRVILVASSHHASDDDDDPRLSSAVEQDIYNGFHPNKPLTKQPKEREREKSNEQRVLLFDLLASSLPLGGVGLVGLVGTAAAAAAALERFKNAALGGLKRPPQGRLVCLDLRVF